MRQGFLFLLGFGFKMEEFKVFGLQGCNVERDNFGRSPCYVLQPTGEHDVPLHSRR